MRLGESRWLWIAPVLAIGLAAVLGLAAGSGRGTLALGAVLAVCGAAIVARRPRVGILAVAGVAPALAGLNSGIPVPHVRLSQVLVVGVWLVIRSSSRAPRWDAVDYAAGAYAGMALLFGVWDTESGRGPLGTAALDTMLGPVQYFLLYRTIRMWAATRERRSFVIRWILLASVPVAILALAQVANVPGTRTLAVRYAGNVDELKTYSAFFRATALFSQGHVLAAYLMVVIALAAACLIGDRSVGLARSSLTGIIVLDAAALGATATATPTIGLVVCAVLLGWWYGKLGRTTLALSVLACVGAILFAGTLAKKFSEETSTSSAITAGIVVNTGGPLPNTVAFRLALWEREFLPTIDRHLWTGYGPNLPPGAIWQYTESFYITLLLRGGIPFLAVFLLMMVVAGRAGFRRRGDQRALGRTLTVVVLVLTAMHTQENYFVYDGFAQVWWILLGLTVASGTATARVARTEIAGVQSSRRRLGRDSLAEVELAR